MHANFLNTHIIVSENANPTGLIETKICSSADEANNSFENRISLLQGGVDNDGDGDTTDTKYRWIAWYGKGRLIKYRKLDQ